MTIIMHCIRVLFRRKHFGFLNTGPEKNSKYIAVAYATGVAYATFPSITIVIIEGNYYSLFVEPFKIFPSHMKYIMGM